MIREFFGNWAKIALVLTLVAQPVFFAHVDAAEDAATFRRIYLARHGQRPAKGDPALTELGREQARLLGERLKSESFKGRIYASPYLRTVETAVQIARAVGGKVLLNPLIQERTHKPGKPDIAGLSQGELSKIFPGFISERPELPYPWVYDDNAGEMLLKRVERAIYEALAKGGDFILVGHKATVLAGLKILGARAGVELDAKVWNCTLAYFIADADGNVKFVGFGTGFIPPPMITDNTKAPLLEN